MVANEMANNNKIITVVLDFIGAKFDLLPPSQNTKHCMLIFFFLFTINHFDRMAIFNNSQLICRKLYFKISQHFINLNLKCSRTELILTCNWVVILKFTDSIYNI